MPSFFDRLFGVQDIPKFQNPSYAETLSNVSAMVPETADVNARFNELIAPRYAGAMRSAENVFDPGMGALREAETSAIMERLLGRGQLAPDTVRNMLQVGMERGSQSGLGNSRAGRGLVFADIGRRTEDQINEILNLTGNWVRSSPQVFNPQTSITPGDSFGVFQGQANAQNAWEQYVSQIQSANAVKRVKGPKDLLDETIGNILGYMLGTKGTGSAISGVMGAAGGADAGSGGGASAPYSAGEFSNSPMSTMRF